MTRRLGRPSKLEASLAEEICSRIAGGESLRSVCREAAMPARETVLRWVLRNAAFRNQYEDALRLRAEGYGEEIVELADEAGRQTGAVGVQAARLRVDTRKWVASRLLPKKYGDRASLNIGGQADNPLTFADLAHRARGDEPQR